eukprot:TRINITY_DN735_c0_g2_i3.p1 TRINITY_DN735_c0_g2~~TRINITY_DN735_c0_g2_i3.p1  ORF type:complete len:399 (+),score=64.22 TRINITY_DN735_c0_g2_i3:888-2084(+)
MPCKALENGFIVREFDPEKDDEACKRLEAHAQMKAGYLQKLLFKAQLVINDRYATKVNQYDNHAIFVVDNEEGEVVAAVCLGLKNVTLYGKPATVGYLFDLRVHEKAQRKGLGETLSNKAEQWAFDQGATMIYLTVNSNNTSALSLYAKLGYSVVSLREPSNSLLVFSAQNAKGEVETYKGRDAVDILTPYFESRDMFTGFEGLFNSPFYYKTLVARDESTDSFASVSLWNGSALTGVLLYRVVLPSWVIGSRVFQYSTFILGLWLSICFGSTAYEEFSLLNGVLCVVFLAVVLVGAFLKHSLDPVLCAPKQQIRCRCFAPVCSGPNGHILLKHVLDHAKAFAKQQGFAVLICNLDRDDPVRVSFSRGAYRTQFHAKMRDGSVAPRFQPDNFFDPRDI